MPLRRQEVRVALRDGWPVLFELQGRRWPVDRVIDYWVVQGRWWARDERRRYVRLLSRGRCVELYETDSAWYLSRILD